MSRQDLQLHLRIPNSIKEALQEGAKQQRRTLTAHVVLILEEHVNTHRAGHPNIVPTDYQE